MKKPGKKSFAYKVEYERAPVLNGILPETCAKTVKAAKELLQERFPTAKKITVAEAKLERTKNA
jgi:hypothetical protein